MPRQLARPLPPLPPLAAQLHHPPSPAMPPLAAHRAGALPGMPAAIPLEPRPALILFGVLLTLLAAWMLLALLPGHRPMNQAEWLFFLAEGLRQGVDRSEHWVFDARTYRLTFVLALLLGAMGLLQIIEGLTYRAYREVTCRQCRTRVVAKKTFLGLRCPLGLHAATFHSAALLLVFVLAAAAGFLGFRLALP